MLRVGLPENTPQASLSEFPKEVQLVLLPNHSSTVQEVEFWIPSLYRRFAEPQYAWLRGVKVVQSLYAGVDWMLPWLGPGTMVCDAQGVHNLPVAEWTVGVILAALKRFPEYRDRQHEQFWDGQLPGGKFPEDNTPPPYRILGEELAGKRVLIVGYGGIGESIEKMLKAFDVEFLRVARTARPGVSPVTELPHLLPQADIVILIVPLTKETRGMMNAAMFDCMKPGALLVNAARGPVADTDALLRALQSGRIHAVLDVMEPEPLPKGHPLWTAPNCFITPHVAGSTPEFYVRGYRFAAEQVRRYLAGQPLKNLVNPIGY